MWVRFEEAHRHRVGRATVMRYRAGGIYNVPRPLGRAVIEAGKAVATINPKKHENSKQHGAGDGAEERGGQPQSEGGV